MVVQGITLSGFCGWVAQVACGWCGVPTWGASGLAVQHLYSWSTPLVHVNKPDWLEL